MYFRLDVALQQRTRKLDEMRALVDKAQVEKRNLSRSENAKVRALEAEIEKIDEDIRADNASLGIPEDTGFDVFKRGAALANRAATTAREGDAIGLRRGESMQAWAEKRNGYFGATGDGLESGDASEMNLGSIVRAMVTGRRDGMSEAEKRALSEGTDSAGGYLTPEILSARLIDRVRNTGKVFAAGATVVPLESDTVNIARLVSGVTPTWKAEGDAVAVSDMTFDRVSLKPKTLPVLVKLSQELFDDVSPASYALIENEIAKAIGLEVDRAALYGDGSGATPLGIKARASEGVVLTAFGGANGGTPTNYDFLLDGIQTLAAANFNADGVMLAPRTVRTLNGLKDSQNRYLEAPQSVKDVTQYVTNQVPTGLTVGTSNGVCSDVFVGEWSNLLVGVRPTLGLRVKVLDQRFADNMQVGILCWVRVDFALAHGAAFNVISGVKP